MDALLERAKPFQGYILPFLVGGLALAAAAIGAWLTGSDTLGGLNGFIEGLSGRSGSRLSNIGFLAPLGFAFGAGMVASVNPCGFAMLPAYLGLYIGSNDPQTAASGPAQKLARALMVGLIVTSGFILLFGVAGVVIGAGARFVVGAIPWIGLIIGAILTLAGSWLLGGGKIYSGLGARAASHIGGTPGQVSVKSYFLFGLSYGTASLSCTLPIFLSVIGISLVTSDIWTAIRQFILYALGMGLVIVLMTVGMALFKEAIVRMMRGGQRYVQPASAVFMILAGCYIVYYWLTLGRDLL